MAFEFSDYRLRVATEQDREHCQRWIDADVAHTGKAKVEFFLGLTPECEQDPGVEAMVLEDKFGEPIFYFRMARALRLDIQFGPDHTNPQKKRTAEALTDGIAWLRLRCLDAVIRQIYFESSAPLLVRFAERKLGFEKSPNELVAPIHVPAPQGEQEKDTHHEHETA